MRAGITHNGISIRAIRILFVDAKDLETLEARGVETVLTEVAQGVHGDPGSHRRSDVEAWVRSKQSAFRDEREASTIEIAREANSIAREANRLTRRRTMISNMIAVAAMMIAAIAARDDIKWLISGLIDRLFRH